jgi:hypothetical protein
VHQIDILSKEYNNHKQAHLARFSSIRTKVNTICSLFQESAVEETKLVNFNECKQVLGDDDEEMESLLRRLSYIEAQCLKLLSTESKTTGMNVALITNPYTEWRANGRDTTKEHYFELQSHPRTQQIDDANRESTTHFPAKVSRKNKRENASISKVA